MMSLVRLAALLIFAEQLSTKFFSLGAMVQARSPTWPSALPPQCRFWEQRRRCSGMPAPTLQEISTCSQSCTPQQQDSRQSNPCCMHDAIYNEQHDLMLRAA